MTAIAVESAWAENMKSYAQDQRLPPVTVSIRNEERYNSHIRRIVKTKRILECIR